MSFVSESISEGFGVEKVHIKQTLSQSFDPFSGMDINAVSFQNTKQGFIDSDRDKRISLGIFSFDEENLSSDNFPGVLGKPFRGITKRNMIKNGDCKFIEKGFLFQNEAPLLVQPEGEWQFLSFYRITDSELQQYFGTTSAGDSQGYIGHGGSRTYVPLSKELDIGFNYWGKCEDALTDTNSKYYFLNNPTQDSDFTQERINQYLNTNTLYLVRQYNSFDFNGGEAAGYEDMPHIAMWPVTSEAYSHDRCLCFMNFQTWGNSEVYRYTKPQSDAGQYIFNWLMYDDEHEYGLCNSVNAGISSVLPLRQYRVLNQVQKIYDKFYDEPITPYSSLKIRFKMKTTHVLPPNNVINNADDKQTFLENPLDKDLDYAPKVEVGILHSQLEETPKAGVNGVLPADTDGLESGMEHFRFKAPGSWNSERYFKGDTYLDKKDSPLGGSSRFQNSVMNEWETFEFNFNLTEDHLNKGMIYGVPYGGNFDDAENIGPVEIMINHNFADQQPTPNPGELFFKVPGYQESDAADRPTEFYIIPPTNWSGFGDNVFVRHGATDNVDYMVVASGLGDDGGGAGTQRTGLQEDGTFLEAYVMFVGTMNLTMNSGLGYSSADMVIAYWDGERWSYDSNAGYTTSNYFIPNHQCFIIARVYSNGDESGITGIDQYISNESQFPTDGIGNLSLFLQAGNNFQGRVLIDNIECFESYEFYPEVDVRKKKSVGNYGKADLTHYYDKDLQPEQYKDSQAPLEAQFYFYPQYPTNELLEIGRLPIYQDFKMGKFYLYDIDWGDGTPKEFTSTPKQIDENTAIYHTYESNGIFEVTGTMIRVKIDNDDNIVGVAHNKNFQLNININPGTDEDFQYFGSDGYSFIPYEKTTPIIGGISNQSNYYKKIKRQIGFLTDEKIEIEFKNQSDKLKTELALLKMENQNFEDLEVLPNYMIPRYGVSGDINLVNQQTVVWPGPDLVINESNIPEHITSIQGDGEAAILADWGWAGSLDTLITEKSYTFFLDNNGISWNLIPQLIYKGITPIKEELGKSIGDCDISSVKYYNKSKSIWELFGFESEDYIEVGNPNDERYWKNTIPKDYSIFNRHGLDDEFIDTYSTQEWLDDYYYPVLPKYGQDGKFIEDTLVDNKTPFPLEADITDEFELNENLIINISKEKIEVDTLSDDSGNKNYGFAIKDFNPEFDDKTLRVKKVKQKGVYHISKVKGAF